MVRNQPRGVRAMDETDILTPSQKKLFKDQEFWMKDVHVKYDEERTRMDAVDDIQKRFPTESIARKAVESGGDPAVIDWYSRSKSKITKKRYRSAKRSKSSVKCKCH